jgi:hypothetical protein
VRSPSNRVTMIYCVKWNELHPSSLCSKKLLLVSVFQQPWPFSLLSQRSSSDTALHHNVTSNVRNSLADRIAMNMLPFIVSSTVYRMFLKCFDKHQDWVLHTKTKKKEFNISIQQTLVEVQHPRLSSLNPSDFYLWVHSKTQLYSAPLEKKMPSKFVSCPSYRSLPPPGLLKWCDSQWSDEFVSTLIGV